MNTKTKKIAIGTIASFALIATPIISVVSCRSKDTKSDSNWKTSKTIVVTVDGAQKNMYVKAVELFNKSEFDKDGYTIKQINKDVFGAIDMVKSVGFTDENVGDLL